MKITKFSPGGLPIAFAGPFTGVLSVNSNFNTTDGGFSATNFVQGITAEGSNMLTRPVANFAAGSNVWLTLDAGPGNSIPSNTIRIHSLGGSGTVSAGSNSTRVREVSTAGASTSLWSPFDHAHDGIGTITSSSSNTMQRGTWNIRPGAGIALSLTDTDGDGEFDTTTIVNTGTGSGGGQDVSCGCSVSGTSTALSSGAFVSLAFGSADTFDTDDFHDPSTNNTRLTVPTGKDGKYLFVIHTTWPTSGSANTDRRIGYRIDGGSDVILERDTDSVTSLAIYRSSSVILALSAGQYVEARQWTGIGSTTAGTYSAQLMLLGT